MFNPLYFSAGWIIDDIERGSGLGNASVLGQIMNILPAMFSRYQQSCSVDINSHDQ